MVTSPHHLASEAGLRVLREGGNAIEATVAMAAALSFVLGAITWAALAFARSLTGSSVAAAG